MDINGNRADESEIIHFQLLSKAENNEKTHFVINKRLNYADDDDDA